ncbi:MAG: PKD domain-containing protein [Myxococcota bacterium]
MLTSRVLFFVSVVLPSSVSPALAAGETPVAEAGLGLIAYVDDTVILDGSGSYDPEGDALTYAWTQVGGPPVQLQDAETAQPRFEIGTAGTLRFELVVSDDLSASAPDLVEVVVPYERIEGVETSCAVVPGLSAAAAALSLAALAGRRRR